MVMAKATVSSNEDSWPAKATDLRTRAWRLFFEQHARLVGMLEDELRSGLDLSLTWYDVLLHLAEAPQNRLRMRELSDALVISKSGLTGLIDRMEKARLVERRQVAGDRRAVEVGLTPAGHARFEGAARLHRAGVHRHFVERLEEADGAALLAIFEKL